MDETYIDNSSLEDSSSFVDSEHSPYEALTANEVVQHMDDCIKEVQNVIELPSTTIRILLNHFKWDKEKLMEKYYDGDHETFFREAHVINPFNRPHNRTKRRSVKKAVKLFCEVCLSNVSSNTMKGLECDHKCCKQCYIGYLTEKIMDEGLGLTIPCVAFGCGIIVDDEFVIKLITDATVKHKYKYLITKSFVECNRLMRWCPSPNCTYAVKVIYPGACSVTCECGHVFCFGCGADCHEPISCQYLIKWNKKCKDDSETYNWIVTNTKECPKCHVSIEKNGGCNHMTCRKSSCRYEFCWVCYGPWSGHTSCNQYKDKETETRKKSRIHLTRYLHFYSRYTNQMQSLKFEQSLYDCVKLKMEEMQKYNMSWIDVQFLNSAVDILCQCRKTLMYTFVFAFYLDVDKMNHESAIFEQNQNDLDKATEQLSEYLERDVSKSSEQLSDIKQIVQNKSQYCEKRRQVLLKHVQEGYDQNSWIYFE